MSGAIAERILHRTAEVNPKLLQTIFVKIANALAIHVNRDAIIYRTPEARLAGRLFDADTVVRPLLGELAEGLYVLVQKHWQWNSRFWEQRALLIADDDLDVAIRYARQAVAIEEHPFPLTTLGKLLLKQMNSVPGSRASLFDEAFDKLSMAIESEMAHSRTSIHPYATMLNGTTRYLELGGELTGPQYRRLRNYISEAKDYFPRDILIDSELRRLGYLINLR
jgi:hypothetical protein